jgi:hypothetical protein
MKVCHCRFLPFSPCGRRWREAPDEGFLPLGKLCENILQDSGWLLQHIIVPIACNSESFGRQTGVSRCVSIRFGVLTTINFDDEALLEANEIENPISKWDLPAKFVSLKTSIAE